MERETIENRWISASKLEYFPGTCASKEEINALCRVIKRYGGIYTTHVKNRDEHYKQGFGEAFDTANQTGVRLQISHAVPKYGATDEAKDWFLDQLDTYQKRLNIACDVIPYEWGPTSMTAILPADILKHDISEVIHWKIFSGKRKTFRSKKWQIATKGGFRLKCRYAFPDERINWACLILPKRSALPRSKSVVFDLNLNNIPHQPCNGDCR
jgi:hypothetical protein